MSTRNIRKLVEKLKLASNDPEGPMSGSEDDHFEPLYASKPAPAFAGLILSSSSSDADDSANESEKNHRAEPAPAPVEKKRNKNNRKKRNKKKRAEASCSGVNKDSSEHSDCDEVARVVAEVNKLLGEPEPPPPEPVTVPSHVLLKIDHKHLNVHNELNRFFGPDENDRGNRRGGVRHTRRQIVMTKDTYDFSVKGLSMSLITTKNGIKFFKFEHGYEYQKNMRKLLTVLKIEQEGYHGQEYEVYPSSTVESLIQNLALYFRLDEAAIAANALEQIIYFMQSIFELSFNYLDGQSRLEYVHVENRAFHITLLMYLHILTNKACHRTALEVAKLMLNLDPTDPLGVIFIIDTIALRAREHQWLVDVYSQWAHEKDATRLFHIRYSYALAMYHLYLKDKDQAKLHRANCLLRHALIKFPNVCVMLMEQCKQVNAEVKNHEMFAKLVDATTSADLKKLQMLYAKFVWPKWRESKIIDWVIDTALQLVEQYNRDATLKEYIRKIGEERSRLFRKHPIEIKRHLSVIGCMSDLLVEGEVPVLDKTLAFNPFPNQGRCIDVHQYYKEWGVAYPMVITDSQRGLIRTFISSLIPDAVSPPENGGGCPYLDFEYRGLNRLGDFYYALPWWSFEVQEDRRLDAMPRLHPLGGYRDLEIRVLQRHLMFIGAPISSLPSRRPQIYGALHETLLLYPLRPDIQQH